MTTDRPTLPTEAGPPPAATSAALLSPRFNVGDSVRSLKTGEVGTVISCKAHSVWVQLSGDDERRMWWLDEVEVVG